MSFLAPSSPPNPIPPPAPVARDDTAVLEARQKERRAARLRVGRAATILTGGAGLLDPVSVSRKRLLGE